MITRLAILNKTVADCDVALKKFDYLIARSRYGRKANRVPEKDARIANEERILLWSQVKTNNSCIDVASRIEELRIAKDKVEDKLRDLNGESEEAG
jgi:hypothetical protein